MNKKAKVLRDYGRLCSTYSDCFGCPLEQLHDGSCSEAFADNAEKAVEIIEAWAKENREKVRLSSKANGEVIKIADVEFIVLEQSGDTTAVILKDFLFDSKQFGSCNNYNGSDVDKMCSNFANLLSGVVGEDNIVTHTVDLTSDDGLTDYGTVKRKASLLTANLYRRYVHILDKYKLNKWWWLATAFSTPTHGYDKTVKCVSPVGCILSSNYYGNFGVRPFCILKSNIVVS